MGFSLKKLVKQIAKGSSGGKTPLPKPKDIEKGIKELKKVVKEVKKLK